MSNIETIELSMEEAKGLIVRRDKLNKLTSNREFKAIILEGYLRDEAVRLVGLSADETLPVDTREKVQDAIRAISHFKQFLRHINMFGEMAERDLAVAENELAMARAEEDFGLEGN